MPGVDVRLGAGSGTGITGAGAIKNGPVSGN
nr:MAG TPA: hypothetical protein [Caudoviricetes sp.]